MSVIRQASLQFPGARLKRSVAKLREITAANHASEPLRRPTEEPEDLLPRPGAPAPATALLYANPHTEPSHTGEGQDPRRMSVAVAPVVPVVPAGGPATGEDDEEDEEGTGRRRRFRRRARRLGERIRGLVRRNGTNGNQSDEHNECVDDQGTG